MIRYLRPDSSECSRRSSVAHSTYSGIDSSSKPMNSITRFVAPASTTMPSTETSNSAWYSPCPASAAASERIDSSVAASAPAANTIVSASVRLSIASAPETTSSLSSHCHTPSPTAAPSVTTVRSGTSTFAHERRPQQPRHQHEAGADRQRHQRRDRRPVDVRALHSTTCSDRGLGRRLGRRQRALRVERERDDRQHQRHDHDRVGDRQLTRLDAVAGCRLCMVRMNIRSM